LSETPYGACRNERNIRLPFAPAALGQFVATAVAEKLAVMNAATFFAELKCRSDLKAFRRLLSRRGGEAPRRGDERSGPPIALPREVPERLLAP